MEESCTVKSQFEVSLVVSKVQHKIENISRKHYTDYMKSKTNSMLHSGFIEPYELLNMFRALLCPSSGACDYTDGPSICHLTLVSSETSLQPDAQTYSHAPEQQTAITKVMCHIRERTVGNS